jgi:hypothetical protein
MLPSDLACEPLSRPGQNGPKPTCQFPVRIVNSAPGEHHVTVSAIPSDMQTAEVRHDFWPTRGEAKPRRDYLAISLATEITARCGEILGFVE